MKTFTGIVLGFLFVILAETGYSQWWQADTVRQSNKIKFFITAIEPFDQWSPDTITWGLMGDNTHRYANLFPQDTGLSLNGEWRGIWDFSITGRTATPSSITTGGQSASSLDVIMLGSQVLIASLQNAHILRFETERHTRRSNDTNEYCGFWSHDSLVGVNVYDNDATFPHFLIGSPYQSDTLSNAVQLRTNHDTAGVFCDSYWYENFLNGHHKGTDPYLWYRVYGRPLVARFRVRVDSLINTSLHTPLFRFTVRQGDSTSMAIALDTIVNGDEWIKHATSDYDTISLHFRSLDTSNNVPAPKTLFTLTWLDSVNLTMDYMEIFTGRLADADYALYLHEGTSGEKTYSYSYEELTENNEAKLKTLIHNIKDTFMGKIQYVMTREEFGLSNDLIFKRAAKLLRDSTNGEMEMLTSIHDTDAIYDGDNSFYGLGLPNQFSNLNEGVQKGWYRGWYPDSMLADPKIFIIGQNPWNWGVPLPRRDISTGSTYQTWENTHVTTGLSWNPCDLANSALHYSRNNYLQQAQYTLNYGVLKGLRHAERSCLRTGAHFFDFFESEGSVKLFKDSCGDVVMGGSYRGYTGAEFKEVSNLVTSCGSLGIILYLLSAPDSAYIYNTNSIGDGTFMGHNGEHSEQLHTFTLNNGGTPLSTSLFIGWKEVYDTAISQFRHLRLYGNSLANSRYVGDWTAAELQNISSAWRDSLPFAFNSIVTLNDSIVKDTLIKNDSLTNVPNTANLTFVHISMWIDNDSTAKALHKDTLLYITNMRTDDSYDTTAVPTTIDRRFITMRFKGAHIIQDVADTNGGQLDNGKIWTPYVDTLAGDSLKLQLLAGDGILIRLMDTVYGTSLPMRVAINFPKSGNDFNDKGRVKFDRPVAGVKNITNDWSVPSTHKAYTVGIPDTTHAQLWQDSLLYQRVDTVSNTRIGRWRNQNWTEGSSTPGITFNFKRQLLPTTATRRDAQISTDSLSHKIIIRTDLEGTGSGGSIRFKDPFLVDSATLSNVYDTLLKTSPFLPHIIPVGRMPGADSQHYGGIFLFQNERHLSNVPIYTLKAPKILKAGTLTPQDTGFASPGDWVFLYWASNDTIYSGDTQPWQINSNDATYPLMDTNRIADVVFAKDSAQYIARYHCHLCAYNSGSAPNIDSGLLWNNQRKLYYTGTDGLGRRTYRMVYSSGGRIYTASGFRTGTGDSAITWNNEQCVSEVGDTHARFPSMTGHRNPSDTSFSYVYQKDSGDHTDIILAHTSPVVGYFDSDTSGGFTREWLNNTDPEALYWDGGALDATPVIFSITGHDGKPIDIIAWSTLHWGIIVYALYNWQDPTVSTQTEYIVMSDSIKHPRHPAIWIDTAYSVVGNTTKYHLTLAWQQDTTMNVVRNNFWAAGDTTYTDVFVVTFDIVQKPFEIDTLGIFRYDTVTVGYDTVLHQPITVIDTIYDLHIPAWFYFDTLAGEKQLHPKDVSYDLKMDSYDNRNPCITGTGYDTNTSKIRIAYETSTYDAIPGHPGFLTQGISAIHRQTGVGGGGWTYTKYFQTSDTLNDKFTKPSIEITRYHDSSGAFVKKQNFYSLAHEKSNGKSTRHWGMDNNNPRSVAGVTITKDFTGMSNPQLSVVRESLDSDVYRMSINNSYPHILTPGYKGLSDKISAGDTIWNYTEIEEPDSTRSFYTSHGVGEYAVDNGVTTSELDFIDHNDTEVIDAGHTAGYFTQSENFTLPASGTFSYFRWVFLTDTTLYKTKFDTIEYALDFFDTTGAFVCRLDSVYLCDSNLAVNRGTTVIPVDRDNDAFGYVRFIRVTGCLPDSGKVIPILRENRASDASYKQGRPTSVSIDDIPFIAEPNPTQGDVKLTFAIPSAGMVSIEAYDQLGMKVSQISESRNFSAGEHHLYWHPQQLSEGMYYIHLNYGNLQKVLRVIYQR